MGQGMSDELVRSNLIGPFLLKRSADLSQDLMRKEYMGEVTIPLVDWFEGEDVKLWHEDLPVSCSSNLAIQGYTEGAQHLTHRLLSTRRRHKVSGTVSLQIGFIEPKNATSAEDALRQVRMVYGALAERSSVGRGRVGVLGVPAVRGYSIQSIYEWLTRHSMRA